MFLYELVAVYVLLLYLTLFAPQYNSCNNGAVCPGKCDHRSNCLHNIITEEKHFEAKGKAGVKGRDDNNEEAGCF
jgi:hypothetical protein